MKRLGIISICLLLLLIGCKVQEDNHSIADANNDIPVEAQSSSNVVSQNNESSHYIADNTPNSSHPTGSSGMGVVDLSNLIDQKFGNWFLNTSDNAETQMIRMNTSQTYLALGYLTWDEKAQTGEIAIENANNVFGLSVIADDKTETRIMELDDEEYSFQWSLQWLSNTMLLINDSYIYDASKKQIIEIEFPFPAVMTDHNTSNSATLQKYISHGTTPVFYNHFLAYTFDINFNAVIGIFDFEKWEWIFVYQPQDVLEEMESGYIEGAAVSWNKGDLYYTVTQHLPASGPEKKSQRMNCVTYRYSLENHESIPLNQTQRAEGRIYGGNSGIFLIAHSDGSCSIINRSTSTYIEDVIVFDGPATAHSFYGFWGDNILIFNYSEELRGYDITQNSWVDFENTDTLLDVFHWSYDQSLIDCTYSDHSYKLFALDSK